MSAIRPGGSGDVDKTHLVWNRRKVVPKKRRDDDSPADYDLEL